ncbi:MAG: 16S rRNA (guanine(966)-N(2))-methyltransferase RsmD [candidate division WOR-3 bacterium]
MPRVIYMDSGHIIMRITAGIKKGETLRIAKRGIRPTRRLVRQAIFNVIGEKIYQASVLDIFAGTGAMGIEAISRGAKSVVFIEVNPRVLITNLRRLDLKEGVQVIGGDFRPALKKLSGREFDIIFLDPPYKKNYLSFALRLIKEKNLLKGEGVIIAEHRAHTQFEIPPGLYLLKKRRYGDTEILFILAKEKL